MFNSVLEVIAVAFIVLLWILVGMAMIAHEEKMGRWVAPKTFLSRLFTVMASAVILPVFLPTFIMGLKDDRLSLNVPTKRY